MIAALVGAVMLMQIVATDDLRHDAILVSRTSSLPEKLLGERRPMCAPKNVFVDHISPHVERRFGAKFDAKNVFIRNPSINPRSHFNALLLRDKPTPDQRPRDRELKSGGKLRGQDRTLNSPTDFFGRSVARVDESRSGLKFHCGVLVGCSANEDAEIGAQLDFSLRLLASTNLPININALNDLIGINGHRGRNAFHSVGGASGLDYRILHFGGLVFSRGLGVAAQIEGGAPEAIRRYKEQCGDKRQYTREGRYRVVRCPYPKGFMGWLLLRAYGLGLLVALGLFGPAMWLDRKRSK